VKKTQREFRAAAASRRIASSGGGEVNLFFFEIKYCCDILIKQLVQYNLVLNANWSNSKPFVTNFIFAA
jgi:hypothetical protein